MKIYLSSLKLTNFRGYLNTLIKFDANMNVILGKNDVGKSTMLDALEIFFNGDQVKIEKDDKNVNSTDNIVGIDCTFKICDDAKIIIDSTVSIDLKDEFLLNEQGELEILKEWDCSKESVGNKDLKTYLICNYPNIGANALVCEKISNLKNTLKNAVTQDIYNDTDKTKSSNIRKALYNTLINSSTKFEKTKIDTSLEDAKDIWKSLNNCLPLFFLFKADRLNSDKDAEVQSPMKAITKTVSHTMQAKFEEIKTEIEKKIEELGKATIDKLADMNPEIAKTLKPHVNTKSLDSLFSFDLISDNNIPLNKRGSGIRRLIVLSYFRAEAERDLHEKHNNSIIYAIEEPETAQHPDFQRMIINTLIELSNDGCHQIIITSHTPEIAKIVNKEQLIFIKKDIDDIPYILNDEETKYKTIVEELGILPFAINKCVICVEGRNDVNFIENISKLPEIKDIIDIEKENIKILPLFGNNLITWLNENYLKDTNVLELHLYDNDKEDYIEKAKEINNAMDGRRYAMITRSLEMENYMPPKYIEDRFKIDLSSYTKDWATIDIPKTLNKLVLQEENENKRERSIKKIINNELSPLITCQDLKDLNVFDEIEHFFKILKKIYLNNIIDSSIYKS